MSIRILMVVGRLSDNYGGIPKMVTELSRAIGNVGLDIDLITTKVSSCNGFLLNSNQFDRQGSYNIRYFNGYINGDFVFSFSLILWLLKNIKSYDIVHTHAVFTPLISIVHLICQLYKIPYIMTPHGMLEPWALSYKSKKKKIYYDFLEKQALYKSRAIHCLSALEIRNINNLSFRSKTILIPNGINRDNFLNLPISNCFYDRFPEVQDKFMILFLGRIDPKKGLDLLAPAFLRVHARFPNTHLVIAGPDTVGFLSTVQSYFNQENHTKAVTFTGMLTGQLKYEALSATNLYVSTSYSEGFSMSVLEGMASGLPCVITTGCNFPEAKIAKAACVVDIHVDAISNAMIWLLENPDRAREMGQRARQFIFQNYTWEEAAMKLFETYRSIHESSQNNC